MKKNVKQTGQGLSEYLITLLLIVIAAVAIYVIFGDVVRDKDDEYGAVEPATYQNEAEAPQSDTTPEPVTD